MAIKPSAKPVPDKLVVLTFDDAVSNHATFVAPLLLQLGFSATFFVCEFPGFENKKQYMTWEQIASLHTMGFEVGNHTLTHPTLDQLSPAEQCAQVAELEVRCRRYGIPVPETFAYPGCVTSAETIAMLPQKGYTLARVCGNKACDPLTDNPMLVPAIGVNGTDPKVFINATEQAKNGRIPVLLFHGVPDIEHPWVDTQQPLFVEHMQYLKRNGYRVISFKQLADYFPPEKIAKAKQVRQTYRPKAVWKGNTVTNEPLFFIQQPNDATATARLLFPPTELQTLASADGKQSYVEGKDYVWHKNSQIIALTASSRIPFKTKAQMYPPKGSPQTIDQGRGGDHALFFGEGTLYHGLQSVVCYQHTKRWTGFRPTSEVNLLPRTESILNGRKKLIISLLGDSISTGANATGCTFISPYQPFYLNLCADELRTKYKTDIAAINHSVGGMTSDWGVTQTDAVIADNPDLCLIAFGMNDAWGLEASKYADNVKKMMAAVKAKFPQTEFLLISGMLPNSDWMPDNALVRFDEYRQALMNMRTRGVAVADVTSLWRDIVKIKGFSSLTGNGVNHPNDFGHRIYAQAILGCLNIVL